MTQLTLNSVQGQLYTGSYASSITTANALSLSPKTLVTYLQSDTTVAHAYARTDDLQRVGDVGEGVVEVGVLPVELERRHAERARLDVLEREHRRVEVDVVGGAHRPLLGRRRQLIVERHRRLAVVDAQFVVRVHRRLAHRHRHVDVTG